MNPTNNPKDIPDKVHSILNRIAWFLAILATVKLAVMMYKSLGSPPLIDRLPSIIVPSIMMVFVIAVILKAVLHGIALLAHRMGENDYNKYHKKDDD